jgi:hypothetical protein
MEMKSIIVTSAVAGLLVLGVAGPTMAATPSSEASSSASIAPLGAGEPTSQPNDAVMARLNALRGTQGDAEIQAILTSGKPSESLFDSTSGKYVAAYLTEATVSLFTITPRGPGCATTDACAYSGGTIPYGYSGTGSLAINVPNVTRAAALRHSHAHPKS